MQELQNTRARSLSEIQDQYLPGKIFDKLPDSLAKAFAARPDGCRRSVRILTGREKCGLAPELLQLLTPEFLCSDGSFLRISD